MRTACIYHDTFVNKIMRDLVELEMACNVNVQGKGNLAAKMADTT